MSKLCKQSFNSLLAGSGQRTRRTLSVFRDGGVRSLINADRIGGASCGLVAGPLLPSRSAFWSNPRVAGRELVRSRLPRFEMWKHYSGLGEGDSVAYGVSADESPTRLDLEAGTSTRLN